MKLPYLDSSLPVAERISDLLSRMTLEEKIGQMMQLAALAEDHESYIERYHLGSYLHALGDDALRLQALNQQRSRLKIPLIFGIDAIHGHCLEDKTTVFPVQLAMACTWNTELLKAMGQITANEARASHLHWTFSPVLCVGRDPRWGRTSETFGEDPYLLEQLAVALADGYQSADYPLAACAKHFAAYGETQGGRDSSDAHVSERQMRSIFLPPFERLAKNGCKTFMAGYQSLNGIPCSANQWLLNQVLRDEWKYDGVVVTDWNNCGQMVTLQHAASSIKDAVALCLDASNDIFMSTPDFYDCALELVREGRIPESRIDDSVRRILKLKYELGLFEPQSSPNRERLLSNASRWDKALQASQQSLTLVKNNGALPLRSEPQKLLLVGDNADNVLNQLGDWSFIPGMTAYTDTETHRADTVTLHQALKAYCRNHAITLSFLGADTCGPQCDAQPSVELQRAAADADVVIFCAGDALKQYGEFHDRADLQLTGNQATVFETLIASGTPVISVLMMSKPHCVERILMESAAVVVAFNPGAKGGIALTQCLFGDINPSGRLPISFPRHVGQLPVYYNQAPGWHATISLHYTGKAHYIDLPDTPLLAFGEGLSYSDIHYGEARLTDTQIANDQTAVISVDVHNQSQRSAVEVVQLYVKLCIPGVSSPEKRLLGFRRVDLQAGASCSVDFELNAHSFPVWDRHMEYTNYHGAAELMIGHSSKDDDLQCLTLMVSDY